MTGTAHEFASVRPPLSVRGDQVATEKFYEMREHITQELRRTMLVWLFNHLFQSGRLDRFATIHELDLSNPTPLTRTRWDALEGQLRDSERLLLDAVDHVLGCVSSADPRAAQSIGECLVDARSVWRVGATPDDKHQLERRQPPELIRLAEEAASAGDRAGVHLREAWAKAFARDSDPAAAVHAANKAVETAAKLVVIPDDAKATTGKIHKALSAKPDKWVSDLGPSGVSAVVELMDAVWKGQLRHGDESQPAAESDEQAEMIVHASVLLVHWFQSGRIRRNE